MATSKSPIEIVYGAAGLGNKDKYKGLDDIQPYFDVLDKQGVEKIDTAHLYGNSETYLGQVGAGKKYTFDTKWIAGWTPGSANKDEIISTAQRSLKTLGTQKVCMLFSSEEGTDRNRLTSSISMRRTRRHR